MIIALDKYKRPLGFLTERRCRILMERKRAVLYRVFPTVVILMDVDARTIPDLPSFRIKIDPGSKYTGIAIIRNDTDEFVYAMQIEHRGDAVRAALNKRKNARRNRRSRETEGPNGGTGACQKKINGLTTAAGKTAGSRPVSGAQRIMSFHGYAGLADGST